MTAPTCSILAGRLGDPLGGTASVLSSFLLLEHPGPWGPNVLAEALAPIFGPAPLERMYELWTTQRFRALLIRRPGRAGRKPAEAPTAFVGSTSPESSFLERLPADRLDGLDLDHLAAGLPGHGTPEPGPLFAVCTNGAVDRCCAVRGRPLVAALAEQHPEQTWEVTHVGGCQFAANLLVLPSGLLYGALSPETGLEVATAALTGQVEPAWLRGRTGVTDWAGTAEVGLRQRLDLRASDAVEVLGERLHPEEIEGHVGPQPAGADVWLRAGAETWRATVRADDRGLRTNVCRGPVRILGTTLTDLDLVQSTS